MVSVLLLLHVLVQEIKVPFLLLLLLLFWAFFSPHLRTASTNRLQHLSSFVLAFCALFPHCHHFYTFHRQMLLSPFVVSSCANFFLSRLLSGPQHIVICCFCCFVFVIFVLSGSPNEAGRTRLHQQVSAFILNSWESLFACLCVCACVCVGGGRWVLEFRLMAAGVEPSCKVSMLGCESARTNGRMLGPDLATWTRERGTLAAFRYSLPTLWTETRRGKKKKKKKGEERRKKKRRASVSHLIVVRVGGRRRREGSGRRWRRVDRIGGRRRRRRRVVS